MDQENQAHQSPKSPQPPHRSLGRYLKTMRQKMQESLGETSGAVEIAVEQLDRFERGTERPTEDILMLLISHFGLQEDEAVRVWELAGYDSSARPFVEDRQSYESYDSGERRQSRGEHVQNRQYSHIMLVALDTRVLYTSGVNIAGDNSGVVLSFLQSDVSGKTAYPVSRVGMSYDQAEQLLATLQRVLLHKKYLNGPRQLPPQAS